MIEQNVLEPREIIGLLPEAHVLLFKDFFKDYRSKNDFFNIWQNCLYIYKKYTGNMQYIFNTKTLTQEAYDLVGWEMEKFVFINLILQG